MITIQRSLLHTAPPGWVHSRGKADDTVDLYYPNDVIPPNPGPSALELAKSTKIAEINEECRSRLFTRFGPPEEQVSRSIGVYGEAARLAMSVGIEATVDASNAAQDAILAATTIPQVEAVTVTWPVI